MKATRTINRICNGDHIMKISIEYCSAWNYKPRASGLEAELKKSYDTDVALIASSGGVYEITVDGNLIFSKKKLGRFPEDGEIQRLIGWADLLCCQFFLSVCDYIIDLNDAAQIKADSSAAVYLWF